MTDVDEYESSDGVAKNHSKQERKIKQRKKTKREELFIGRRSSVYEAMLLIRNEANQWAPRVT